MNNTSFTANTVFVIVPVFNEKTVVREVLSSLAAYGYNMVVVDDGSSENITAEIEGIPRLHYLRHKVNLGQGAALQTGIEFALRRKATYLITFDADGQHKASDIEKLLAPLKTDETDIVLASRFLDSSVHNAKKSRVFLLKIARRVNFLFTGLYLSDAHNGLRAMNRKAAASINITENRMAHATQIIAQVRKSKLRFLELPASIVYTDYSKGKGQSGWYSIRIFFDLVLQKLFS
jgi:polyprenyl-phospho-N-acetylgalactosaminyl synthase